MAQVGNWVIENTSTTGQGTITLGGSPTSFVRFRDDLVPGRVWYTIQDGENRESGTGDFDGVATLIRDDIRNTFENGVFDDAPIVGITLSGDSIVACTFNASAFVDFEDNPVIGGFTIPNETFIKGENFLGNGTVDIVKVNASDEIEFGAADVVVPGALSVTGVISAIGGIDVTGALVIDNNTFLQGTDFAGTGVVDIVKVNASDEIEFGAADVIMPGDNLLLGNLETASPTPKMFVIKSHVGNGGDNILRFHDIDAGTAIDQQIGAVEWWSDDSTSPGASVRAKIFSESEDTTAAQRMVFQTSATGGLVTGMTIDSNQDVTIPNGFLGIGTTAPSSPLHIVGTGTTTSLQISNDGAAGWARMSYFVDSSEAMRLYSTTGATILDEVRSLEIRLRTNSTNGLTISSTQDVTIPNGALSVGNNVAPTEQLVVGEIGPAQGYNAIKVGSGAANITTRELTMIANNATGYTALYSEGSLATKMYLSMGISGNAETDKQLEISTTGDVTIPNGSLGIGIAAGAAGELHISAAIPNLRLTDTGDSAFTELTQDFGVSILSCSGGQMRLTVAGTEAMRLSAASLTMSSLAGTGTRTVVVDANGVLSAP